MADRINNERLNDALIDLGRSLLQYAGESWPWTSADEVGERAAVEKMVAEQRETVLQLAELLNERAHRITYGQYPSEYTSLHYVALDYLLDQLASQQQSLAEELSATAADLKSDEHAHAIVTAAAEQAARHQRELEGLIAQRKSPAAAGA